MEMMGKIRRMYFRDKLSLHQIAKRTGLSRNTIRKWVRAPEATQPAYQRCAAFNKLSPFHQTLEQALKADSFRAKHNRRSAKALLEQIKAEGYDGGYSQLTAFIRAWRGEQGKSLRAFVPLTFALGEAFQFDWSEEGLLIGGLFRRIQVSHMKLCASRAFWLVAQARYDLARWQMGIRRAVAQRHNGLSLSLGQCISRRWPCDSRPGIGLDNGCCSPPLQGPQR
ncbi:hypothetical protein PS928_06326 [Pseudomonas fluorescens]|uniref:HTH IS21-type domain-containing protein n=1 Tax=Pseudomonas fluorescens TaxID=294 RepID=A0A5E7VUD3_PSEFL|nr:hypothetical protein PS928_06326 [Pseudomonas fluorescens]